MPVGDRKVVKLAKDVCGDHRGEVVAVLRVVHPVLHVDHALGVGVPLVRRVRRPVVDHRLVDRVGGLVREDARREARDEPPHAALVAAVHHRVLHGDVAPPELDAVGHVGEEPPDVRGEVQAGRGLDAVEERGDGEVGVLGAGKVPLVALDGVRLDDLAEGLADEARASRDEDDGLGRSGGGGRGGRRSRGFARRRRRRRVDGHSGGDRFRWRVV